ncbi:MAG: alkaline phosphatase family protein [Hyphomonadaceae bacterium]|nr:alkaline phosphatase family protein [Hyphomonadaceae bacterium]
MILRRLFLFALCAFALASCAHGQAAQSAAPAQDITILVSVDGFRADYLDRGATPTLSRLAREGVRASMRPSFPSVTFPNHYTLVTGLRPGRNGMINNRMEDPERPGVIFTLQDRQVASDPIWWADAVPIWVTAEQSGVRTGTMFWPGSDYALHGVRPSAWRMFDQSLPSFARVDVLLSWLDLPAAERPQFFTLYFDLVDTAGHRYGPDAMEANAAAAEVDASIARLLAGLQARGYGRRANIVIVADHGMSAVSDERIIDLDSSVSVQQARVIWDGPFAGIAPTPGHEAETESALLGRREHGECWRKGELPERFHYGAHRRTPAIICLADLGWRYRTAQLPQYPGVTSGAHGYDPADPEMAALFVAYGPAFRSGLVLDPFDNVSVYPLLARLIGVTPEANDGDSAATASALR